jgi:hypothetical protein
VAVEEGAAVVEEAITSRKMNAIAHAEQLHSEHVKQRVFIVDLALYLRHGFVHNAPDLFAMWRPVCASASLEQIANAEHAFENPDAWYVDLAVGNLRKLARLLPYELPKICFFRKFHATLKIYPANRFFRKAL